MKPGVKTIVSATITSVRILGFIYSTLKHLIIGSVLIQLEVSTGNDNFRDKCLQSKDTRDKISQGEAIEGSYEESYSISNPLYL